MRPYDDCYEPVEIQGYAWKLDAKGDLVIVPHTIVRMRLRFRQPPTVNGFTWKKAQLINAALSAQPTGQSVKQSGITRAQIMRMLGNAPGR